GAALQRPLWASTSTKNPDYPDTLYVDKLIGPHTVNTAPPKTIDAFVDHGSVAVTIEAGIDEAVQVFTDLEQTGVDMTKVTDQLLTEGVDKFATAFNELIAAIEEKCKVIAA
ncbi:MAG: transaldolase, partial [Chloroflexi bacterium]|nr:transaldolase [Chloroflexota bacterium]